MKVDGKCHCGFIAIEGEADPERVTVCHCTDCQTGTGSAFRNSVPISGGTFKMTGQRVFKMAPLHHHLEKSGWSEPKIISRFVILGILFALFSLTTLKLR